MNTKNNPAIFIQKLWNILETQDKRSISWQNEGLSFAILDQESFTSEILSTHFNQSNYSSFIRQLNMYNFRKNRKNKDKQEFTHELFRMGHRELLVGIKRKPTQADILVGRELLKASGLDYLYSEFQKNQSTEISKNKEDEEIKQGEVLEVLSPKLVYPYPPKNQNLLVWNQGEKSGFSLTYSGKPNNSTIDNSEIIYRTPIYYPTGSLTSGLPYLLSNSNPLCYYFSTDNYAPSCQVPLQYLSAFNLMQAPLLGHRPEHSAIASQF